MAFPVNCSSCDTPVPAGASFCPSCGEATPTEISKETGEALRPDQRDADEADHRVRLRSAIGDGYKLGELIGRGGFGAVYAAWDVELHREVAVKAIRHDLFPTPGLMTRFKREARAVAKLRHPNIIPIYAVGEAEGIAYMIMPKILGESLKAVLERESRLSVAEAQRILIEAAHALGFAHRSGIVHRDVKPENILLEGDERRAYLMDFGIAKALESDEEGLTGTGMIVGTPAFMSPEQASGEGQVDHRSDIYSLGVLGFQLLAGRLPYEAKNLQDLIYHHVTAHPPDLTSLRPEIPPALGQALARCLERSPDKRWASADDLAAALEGKTVTPAATRPLGRRAVPIGAAAILLGVGLYYVFGVLPRPAPETASPDRGAEPSGATGGVAAAEDDSATGAPGEPLVAALPTPEPERTPDDVQAAPAAPPAPDTTAAPPAITRPAQVQQPPALPTVGYLTIDASPWGMVRVDGVDVRATPLTRHALPPGVHVVTVVKDGYETWVDTVTIEAGNELKRRARLIRRQQ